MSTAPMAYGTWPSSLSPRMMAAAMRLYDIQWDSDGETLVWAERREGRGVLVTQRGTEAPCDLTDGSLSVGGRVFYGGGELAVRGGVVVFAAGGRLYRQALAGGLPTPITPAWGVAAAPAISPDGRWVAYVYSVEGRDGLALVDSAGQTWPRQLATQWDFVMQPAWNADGTQLAYIGFNQPNMPWDGTELRLLNFNAEMQVVRDEHIIGDAQTSLMQPTFSPDGQLLAYLSDTDGWWHLYLYDPRTRQHTQITHGEGEDSFPAWVQGIRTYGWAGNHDAIYFVRNQRGTMRLWRYDVSSNFAQAVHDEGLNDYAWFKQVHVAPIQQHERVVMLASGAQTPQRFIAYSPTEGVRVIRRSHTERVPRAQLAHAESIEWHGHDGNPVYGIYWPPAKTQTGIGLPPLIVLVHGGPTSQEWATWKDEAQFFATRGYAVLQPNYRGSTGYGRAYWQMHREAWGIYDVLDSLTGAQYLVDTERADPAKLVIMGSSAGGYTTLQTLIDRPGFFRAGISAYGVADQFGLALETHKFEARYGDWLLGPLPEAAARYRDRSPLFHAHRIKDALLLFQGSEDVVVPPAQSEQIVAALRRNGVAHEYHLFEGEGHGWSKPATIERYYSTIERWLLLNVVYA